jgi:hypothetical protein
MKDKGLIHYPTPNLTIDMFVDSNFCGVWHKEHKHLCDNGYIILFGRCLITWASKLKTKITLSSTESEYSALCTGIREILPLQ